MRHVFLSPHMDDAVLSAGSYLSTLVKEKKDVIVITVFTSFGKRPISWSAQKYLFSSGFFRLTTFEKERKKEDICAMKSLHTPFLHLDFIDGGFRKTVKKINTYKTFSLLFSKIAIVEKTSLIPEITKHLERSLHTEDILYAPLGIGNHVDHFIINRIAQNLPQQTYFWLDQPYAWQKNIITNKQYKEAFRISHKKEKEIALSYYRSQIKNLYPSGIPNSDEIFFTKTTLTI